MKNLSADVCMVCHHEVGEQWEMTKHAVAPPDLLASGHVQNFCINCHVVSKDGNPANSAYDDPDPVVAARFGGVQCESCHGPGSQHVASHDPLLANVSDTLCGSCHTGAHHPTYDEWQTSLHAKALSNVENLPFFRLECMECHSADYIFADSVPETAKPSDFEFGITCVVCHDPHSDDNEFQLRKEPIALCGECHNTESATPGSAVHHPNVELYSGTGGYQYPGETYENSAHSYLEEACVTCHMWTSPFDATGNGENAISGHEFKPVIQACQVCHEDATSFELFGIQTLIQQLLDELEAELDAATDNDKLTLAYEYALFNFEFVNEDGSLGIHNFRYALALLEDSIDNFEPGS